MKIALITGATSGIGEGCARRFARGGYDLIITGRNTGKLEILKKELEAEGVQVLALAFDVRNREAARKAVDYIPQDWRNIDVLINNAAISYVGLLADMTVEQWQQVINTNLSSLFYFCRLAVPGMVHRKQGKIINISSVWGNVGASMEVAYSAAKGGVNSFTKALAKELAPSNIQVNGVSFGIIDTRMNACFSEDELAAIREEIPADRIGTAKEAAEMVRQVLNTPSYFTGQIVTMDGGWQG